MTDVLSQDHHPTLRHEERTAIGQELQIVLVDLIDLSLIGKQLHWNVVGPHFRSLHLQLDEMIDAWRAHGDEVAERSVALGHAPAGQSRDVAEQTRLDEVPPGPIADHEVVRVLTQRLTEALGRTREAMDAVAECDAVTEDVLHAVAGKLEEQLWMIRVQQGGD